jgi:hypothetical protein
VAHGVYPAVKEVETPDAAAVSDRAPVQTGLEQLQLGDHPMSPSRHVGECNVGCGHSV